MDRTCEGCLSASCSTFWEIHDTRSPCPRRAASPSFATGGSAPSAAGRPSSRLPVQRGVGVPSLVKSNANRCCQYVRYPERYRDKRGERLWGSLTPLAPQHPYPNALSRGRRPLGEACFRPPKYITRSARRSRGRRFPACRRAWRSATAPVATAGTKLAVALGPSC
jgi:hypothetical protein